MELKTSKDIFIYLAYYSFTIKEIKEAVGWKSNGTICNKANYLGLYKNNKTKHVNKKGNKSQYFKGYGEVSSIFIGRIRRSAKIRNHDFNLTCKELWELFLQQNKKCYYTGLDLHIGNAQYNTLYSDIGNASVDRIDSCLGYTIDNVVWTCKDINFMKSNFTHKKFVGLCKEIYNHQNNPLIINTKEFKDFIPRNNGAKKRYKGCGQISGSFFKHIKRNALVRKHCFNLTIDEIWELFKKQNGQCIYSGRDLIIRNNIPSKLTYCIPGNASLDRIDSTKGYTIDNVQWIDKDINFMKQKLSHDKFLEYITLIVENHERKNNG